MLYTTLFTVLPLEPIDVVAIADTTSAQLYWTVSRVTFGFETYSVTYGLTLDNLDMQSSTIAGGLDEPNVTYSTVLEDLQPLTTYYYSIRSENSAGVTFTDIENFTTG